MLVSKADQEWMKNVLMPAFGMKRITLVEDLEHTKKYPYIWTDG